MRVFFKLIFCFSLIAMSLFVLAANEKPALSDQEIAYIVIEKSIADYMANHKTCPCPYYVTNEGALCSENSAWAKPVAVKPMCYIKDVPQSIIDIYR